MYNIDFVLSAFFVCFTLSFAMGVALGLWLWHRGKAGRVLRQWTKAIFNFEPKISDEVPFSHPAQDTRAAGEMPKIVNELTEAMAKAMAALPEIQSVDGLFSSLTEDQRNKLAMSLGIEFQRSMVSLTATELEAIVKLRAIPLH